MGAVLSTSSNHEVDIDIYFTDIYVFGLGRRLFLPRWQKQKVYHNKKG